MSAIAPARCVLTLHRVVDVPELDHDVSKRSFARLLDVIRDTVTTDLDLSADGRAVVLTFDDGTADHAGVGDALAERGLAGIFFVPAALVGSDGFLSESDVLRLATQGHVIGSHGLSNIRLDRLDHEALRREVEVSRTRLQEIVGTGAAYFAPPGGSEHALLDAELERSGYTASRSTRWGIHRSGAQRWRIPGIPVTEVTLARNWVQQTLAAWSLPLEMRMVWRAKQLLPDGPRSSMRRVMHRRLAR